jgi:hypothetical protein
MNLYLSMGRRVALPLLLAGFAGLTVLPTVKAHFDFSRDAAILNNSNYKQVYKGTSIYLYGYDDDNNGEIDRIEEIGVVSDFYRVPAMRVRETYLQKDKRFRTYDSLLKGR